MDDGAINRVLFDFTSIIDVDVGIAMMMNLKFNNPNITNSAVMGRSIEDYKYLLLNRLYRNPVIMFLNKEYQGEADGIYAEICSNESVYKDVLARSIPTAIFMMMNNSQDQSSIEPTILCWNEWQTDYIKEATSNRFDVIVRDGDNKVNIDNYDTLIFKYPYSPFMFEGLHGKNIYLCRYRCNMNKKDVTKPEVDDNIKLYYMDANELYVIDVYADAKLDVPNIPEEAL